MTLHRTLWLDTGARLIAFWLPVLMAVASVGVLAADPARAATTFTVNSTADAQDADLADAQCDVNDSASGNQCTLRAAIQEANDTAGADTIRFNIVSSAAVKTISPTRALPTIRQAVTINGYTQPGASANTSAAGNNAVLKVQLNGTNAGGVNGLLITSSDSTIRGLVINRFKQSGNDADGITGNGILIDGSGATGNRVEGNFIGTDAAGGADLGNSVHGVFIDGAPNNTVGGTAAGARNVISGNNNQGVFIVNSGATGNRVQGNFIGTGKNGTADLGNAFEGVSIFGAPNNTIGGTVAGARNIISGNGGHGVEINSSGATGNKVEGNRIGTGVSGGGALGNSLSGVEISGAPNNTVGGTVAGARNIISGNTDDGTSIRNSGATGNRVQGNFIGTGAGGGGALGNSLSGVDISDAPDNTIGGTASGARNVISGNETNGVRVSGAEATGNKVEGNFIGTSASGSGDVGNTEQGVVISSASNTVGGTTEGAGNVISGNGLSGLAVSGPEATGNKVEGNLIGTNAAGTQDLGNGFEGVIVFGAPDNIIGGTTSAARNVISGNGNVGILIIFAEATGNSVQGNFIGTAASGTGDLGNGGDGVVLSSTVSNTIGGTTSAAGNRIAHNRGDGVSVVGDAVGNSILSNSIFSNGDSNSELGINLDTAGVTANDADDTDTGPNNLQNFPVITSATRGTTLPVRTTIQGTLNSTPSQSFTVQCFVAAQDPSGHGEGKTPAGQDTTVTTDANGDASFTCSTLVATKVGFTAVTATATRLDTSTSPATPTETSEFSENVLVSSGR